MSIKRALTKAAEKITGRKCYLCMYNHRGRCCHPDGEMFLRCWQSITRPGFEKRPPRYLKVKDEMAQHRAARNYEAAKAAEVKPAPLTPEQRYQLEKIKETLQEAGNTARESGLLED